MNNKLWFKRKLYGWGWTPITWEGWAVIIIWVVFFLFVIKRMNQASVNNIIVVFVMTALLIFICYKKGEKPRWQWGKRIDDTK